MYNKYFLLLELTSKGRLSSDPIHPPVIIPLPDLSRRLSARGIYNKLERWGIVGRISANNGRQEMSIVKAPTILMKSGSSEVSSVETLKVADTFSFLPYLVVTANLSSCQNLIAELISNQQWSSPGTGWPISLAEVLHSKACHGTYTWTCMQNRLINEMTEISNRETENKHRNSNFPLQCDSDC